jgi:hypothetical protein
MIGQIASSIVAGDDRTIEALLADTALQLFNGLLRRSRWYGGKAGETCRMLLHRVGEVVVGVTRHGDGVGCFHLFDPGRRQRQDLHVDAGRIHVRQPLGIDVAKPIDHLGVAAADLLSAFLYETRRTIKKLWGRKMLFQRNCAHARTFYFNRWEWFNVAGGGCAPASMAGRACPINFLV